MSLTKIKTLVSFRNVNARMFASMGVLDSVQGKHYSPSKRVVLVDIPL